MVPAEVGENDHTEYHLNGTYDFGDSGWGVYAGLVERQLVAPHDMTFYGKLRSKLGWGSHR